MQADNPLKISTHINKFSPAQNTETQGMDTDEGKGSVSVTKPYKKLQHSFLVFLALLLCIYTSWKSENSAKDRKELEIPNFPFRIPFHFVRPFPDIITR